MIITVTAIITMSVIVKSAISGTSSSSSGIITLPTAGTYPLKYPVGTPDKDEASGMGPPNSRAMPGYKMTYSTSFPGGSVPSGWIVYHGQPTNDPGAQFGSAHVVVRGGMLRLNTWRDPGYQNRWVTGGLCLCGTPQTYGAYYVRSRVTGGGPTAVLLLWPASNKWPPEIDFNESSGKIGSTTATVHFGATNQQEHRELRIDMLKWHTWGVIWSPTSIVYTVDGVAWATESNNSASIPNVPMHLAIQQQTACLQGRLCPSAPVSMLVNWVAEYQAS